MQGAAESGEFGRISSEHDSHRHVPMTQVWMTLRGGRYHRTRDCQGLRDGHAKAASEGLPNHPVQEVSLSRAQHTVQPCLRCWREPLANDPWLGSALETELRGDSAYETDFLNGVLRHVTGIDPHHVRVQYEATGESGNRYRIDFAILRTGLPRIAIETDGFQKDKRANEADEARLASSSSRQNDLTSAGWVVLRFTNRQVITSPGSCRSAIEATLNETSRTKPARAPSVPGGGDPKRSASEAAGSPASGPSRYRDLLVGAVLIFAIAIAAGAFLSGKEDGGSVPPAGSDCPASHPIKANGESGVYHAPGWRYYDATNPEECFANAEDAEAAGYRESGVK